MERKALQIFYASDEKFAKYTLVSLVSLIKNASKNNHYHIHILNSDISHETSKMFLALANENFEITMDEVTVYLNSIKDKLPTRDYYSKTTYYRLFISEMYPRIKKAVYLDSDTIIQGDISELFKVDLQDYYVGACVEKVMVDTPVFRNYVEKTLGIAASKYFNAGVMIINCRKFRREYVLDRFLDLLHVYKFVVTQDEDYLNVICHGQVKFIDQRWNVQTYNEPYYPAKKAKLIHYIMQNKPWHYKDCIYEDVFWKYAKMTSCYEAIVDEFNNYTDEMRERDTQQQIALAETAQSEIDSENNYLKSVVRKSMAPDRVAVLEKIQQYEQEGRFDEDVEEDPPAPVLMPDKINYIRTDWISKTKTGLAYLAAHIFIGQQKSKKNFIIREIRGIENLHNLDSGALITCNHFNAFDSFAMYYAYKAAHTNGRTLYRVIREGNYTNFPGLYGFLMRNCDTLPLSSNSRTMRKFMRAVDELLQSGNLILIYPEQSMWWNYRKPKPLKSGGFSIAAKNKVPVLPCFITMQDSQNLGQDGFYVQEYTIHILPPIKPDPTKSYRENLNMMMEENYRVWKEVYEKEYGIPLVYDTDQAILDEKGFSEQFGMQSSK
ncbi:MAG: 1-acyl-sn-glycerol-3-phosphate acyltransferase [Clostridiales bacterium]|nr:1-acyl-sn-glycerol-3-phosphate acyltransferase [Clostridiales bacterium]